MSNQVLSFYDSIADYYHLIFEDRDRSIQRQARSLGSVISRELPGQHLRILDCACGIGTQSLGFAALGHHVVGSDLSPAAVTRAAKEAQQRGLNIEFYVSDMTHLKEIREAGFDVVAAFDNALPHLSSDELIQAVGAMARRLKPGGLFIASIRDYDLLLQQRPAMQEPAFFGTDGSEESSIRFGTGLNQPNTNCTSTSLFRLARIGAHTHFVSEYRCVIRQELSDALRSVGFGGPVWLMPAETGYYQPLVVARWP